MRPKTSALREVNPEDILGPMTLRKRTCGLKGCNEPAKNGGLCQAHYQAIRIRRKSVGEVLGNEPSRLNEAVQVTVRFEKTEDTKLRKAIADGRVKETRYAFLQKAIQDAIGKL